MLCTVHVFRPARCQQNAQCIQSCPLTEVRIVGCVWVSQGLRYIVITLPPPSTVQLQPLSRHFLGYFPARANRRSGLKTRSVIVT
jgi:hypothetical protein